jgi:hypothetical protein
MIYYGIGLDEDTVLKYFAAAKNPDIRGVRLKNIRGYLDQCCHAEDCFLSQRYHIQDPFLRAMIIPNTVLFRVEFEKKPVLGEIIEIKPIPRRYVEDIIDMTPLCQNTAYGSIVGLRHLATERSGRETGQYAATIEYLVKTGIL